MRLTMKDKDGNYYTTGEDIKKAYPKLGQLEDIEEELGIELITLFKALKNGVFVKSDYRDGFGHEDVDSIGLYGLNAIGEREDDTFLLEYKTYGKTWVLTRKELL